ncbi:MAG: DUF6049 family protein [Actinomycetes bacterium]
MSHRLLRTRAAVLAAMLGAALLGPALALPASGTTPAAAASTISTVRAAATSTPTSTPTDEATTSAQQAVSVLIESVEPTPLTPSSTLTVQATVVNRTDEPLRQGEVRLWLRQQRSGTRSALDDWTAGRVGTGTLRKAVPLGADLPPESSRPVTLAVPADQLGLPAGAFEWGPRGIALEVRAGSATVALARSFVVWQADPGGYEPTDVTLVLPVTAGAPDVLTGRLPADLLERLTAPGGRLAAVLGAGALPGVTVALDPAVLGVGTGGTEPGSSAGATASAGTPPPAPESTSPSALAAVEQWQASLATALAGHEVVVLPYGDPDVNALAHANQDGTYELAERYARQTERQVLATAGRSDVAWPVSGSLDDDTVSMLAAAGCTGVILSGGAHPLVGTSGSTPTGRSQIRAGGTAMAGLLVDTPLSTVLSTLGSQSSTSQTQAAAPGAVVQRLLAETAAVTLERPFDPRHLLVAAPRGWDPAPDAAVAAVRALTTAPWLRPRPLADLVSTPPPQLERGPLRYPESDRAAELPAAGLRQAADAVASIRTTASILADPAPVVQAAELSSVAAASAGWRDRRRVWQAELDRFSALAAGQARAVHALPGSGITVVSSKVSLPVTVENTLDQQATVRLRLRPRSSRLVVEDSVLEAVAIGAHSQRRVSIPVQAVGNGNTDVGVQVLTPSGTPLGPPVVLTVRVRADWETRGTLVLGIAVGLVLLVGLVRAVRRGRRQQELRDPLADPSGHGGHSRAEKRAREPQERGA